MESKDSIAASESEGFASQAESTDSVAASESEGFAS
jgi:hypothetical protein